MASVSAEVFGSTFSAKTLPPPARDLICESCFWESASSVMTLTSLPTDSPKSLPPATQLAWYEFDRLRTLSTSCTSSGLTAGPAWAASWLAEEHPGAMAATPRSAAVPMNRRRVGRHAFVGTMGGSPSRRREATSVRRSMLQPDAIETPVARIL